MQIDIPSLLSKLLRTRSLPTSTSVLLVILIGSSAAQLTWQLLPQSDYGFAEIKPDLVRFRPPSEIASGKAEAIVRQHLLGQAVQQVTVKPQTPKDAPDTRLNLDLKGTLAHDKPDEALAIISESGRDEEVYGVGDTLPGNALLEEVYVDRVILRRGGRLETLRLPERTTGVRIQSVPSLSQPSPSATAKELRDEIVRDPVSFSRRVATVPVRKDGKLIGYRLEPKQDESFLEELGLMPDDVIIEVNGTRLEDPRTSLRALRTLATAKSIDLTLLRADVEMPMSFSLE